MSSLGSEDNGVGVGAHFLRPGVERGAQAGVACSCVPNYHEQRGEARDQQEMCVVIGNARSEEHTSELQSPDHLVCRLLLEKKKQINKNKTTITNTYRH